ncbi:MAG TPA: hypothetical protein ACFYD3_09720 [Candidatus Hypogeohydataceae bacterium YC41]
MKSYPRCKYLTFLLCLLLVGCVTTPARVTYQPFKEPFQYSSHINAGDIVIAADPIFDGDAAKKHFTADINEAGLSAIRLIIRNGSGQDIAVGASQIFLESSDGSLVPAIPTEIAAKRLAEAHIMSKTFERSAIYGVGGAAAGAAFGAALSSLAGVDPGWGAAYGGLLGGTVGATHGGFSAGLRRFESRMDSTEELMYVMWKDEVSIPTGTLAHGYIFFPLGYYTKVSVTFMSTTGWTPTFEIPLFYKAVQPSISTASSSLPVLTQTPTVNPHNLYAGQKPVTKELPNQEVKEKGWLEVASFSGNGNTNTSFLKIAGKRWRINWSNIRGGYITITVFRPNGDVVSVAGRGEVNDTHFVYEQGTFYLRVNAPANWTIKVEELK